MIRFKVITFLIVVASMVLAACGPAATEAPAVATEAPAMATEAPAATEAL